MSGIIGRKLGMTSIFDETGNHVVCTVIEAGPCAVTQVKTEKTDGYDAVQLGYGERKEKNTPRAQRGHFKSAGVTPKRKLIEFRDYELPDLSPGDEVRIESVFKEGHLVDVTGMSKGKGFQGVVKRHGFGGVGMVTHGQHNRQRKPGSIGQSSSPSRVVKGMRMGGRTGNSRVKMRDLLVVRILPEHNLLVVKGSVPGPRHGLLRIDLS
jgi:large subunit ribosomal protein L3